MTAAKNRLLWEGVFGKHPMFDKKLAPLETVGVGDRVRLVSHAWHDGRMDVRAEVCDQDHLGADSWRQVAKWGGKDGDQVDREWVGVLLSALLQILVPSIVEPAKGGGS